MVEGMAIKHAAAKVRNLTLREADLPTKEVKNDNVAPDVDGESFILPLYQFSELRDIICVLA